MKQKINNKVKDCFFRKKAQNIDKPLASLIKKKNDRWHK